MKILVAISIVLASSVFAQTPSPSASATAKHPFTFEDMMALKRVGAPMPSPDGKWVVFDCEDVDLAANTKISHLWIVPASGGESRRLNPTPNHEERPRFSPDGKRLVWTSKATDPTQIWMCDFDSNAGSLVGKPHQVTSIPTGADGAIWSPDGKNTSNIDEIEATSTNNEIFIVPMAVASAVPSGEDRQSGKDQDALRTAHATTQPKKISISPGADSTPLYSLDGKYLAWRSQARAGFEADKWRLLVQDRRSGEVRDLKGSDLSIGNIAWADFGSEFADVPDIFFTAEESGGVSVNSMSPKHRGGFAVGVFAFDYPNHADHPEAAPDPHVDNLVFANRTMFFTRNSISGPDEIFRVPLPKPESVIGIHHPEQITHMNEALLSQIDMQPLESFTFKGANDEEVHGFMVKPPGFDPNKKYPLKFLIHGGPQGAWGNSWTYRWNAELFAANGYVVVMINFHGSTGYGQKFTDSISGDWGGKPYVDLMKGLDYVEKTFPFIDKNREAALGASYGGYMANWLLGHTNRFKCIVSHDGMFNAVSAYGTTEELWFAEWEFKGPPWKNRELYRKWSPHEYAQNFKTPTLVVHGQNDYRIDVSQAFDLFTTLQVLKVPSKMLYFPDEGHWVLKPQNSRLWYKTVNEWVDQWCK
jgi:dipeptidyl aminopeptidase/acylaminoacyl peptidase